MRTLYFSLFLETGLKWSTFEGIQNLIEVECSGSTLINDVKLMSLQLYIQPANKLSVSLNVITGTCNTFAFYSSCYVTPNETNNSMVKLLMHLERQEPTEVSCTALFLRSLGDADSLTWTDLVDVANLAISEIICFGLQRCCIG